MNDTIFILSFIIIFLIGDCILSRVQIKICGKIRKVSNEIIEAQKAEIDRLKQELAGVI